MPPRRWSRFTFCTALQDDDGILFLTEREPFGYQPFADNRLHVVQEGESLFTLAGRYFAPLPRPAGLWWVIADFQPEPILDPTIALTPGATLVIPSLQTIQAEIFNERRRETA